MGFTLIKVNKFSGVSVKQYFDFHKILIYSEDESRRLFYDMCQIPAAMFKGSC
jgi:hypothetical protein